MRVGRVTGAVMALLAAACTTSHHTTSREEQPRPSRDAVGVQLCEPGQCHVQGAVPPDEPYRYVKFPAGAQPGLRPQLAQHTVTLSKTGRTPGTFLNSDEQGPQISLYLTPGSLTGPSGTRVSLRARPLAATGAPPADGRIVGNEYSLVAVANGKIARDAAHEIHVQLRVPQPISASGRYLIEFRDGGTWTDLVSTAVGSDLLQAKLPRLGVVAVVQTS